ncbi:unnamed protein product (macronuclear) [Paramecium tetraurelia]|uniref:Uncharacterized protein n=1 Tax=Paramecium tetraurelia TaxID=5888 RepID=A0DGP7_PARTE|nr:uncharacterized protein GSPATT00002343001 [Paramecium tetraurelia]CAK82214.1 unnamed protein product [Paramecium tetraurelia]|eukprot:XP_001449611.1 hypothetical protein (macronuclear) [Paramecium tetraurelia strain d4-2]
MFKKIIQGFSKYSHRSTIPSLLKDPRYTRRGISKPKGETRMLRKPSIPDNIPNAHLYYDHTKFIENQKNNPPTLKYESTDLEFNLSILNNDTYVHTQDFKLWKAMKQLNIHHPTEVKKNWELFDRAYRVILDNARYLDIYNFRSFTQVSQQYYFDDEKVWTTLYRISIQFFVGWEHQQTPLLSKLIEKTHQQSFLFSFNIIMQQARRFKVDVSNVIIHFDYLMRNHLRFSKIHSQEAYNKVENVEDKNQLGNFLSHFAFCIQQRKDIFNDVDKEVKEKQVEEFLHKGQKLCLESFDKLTAGTKKNLLNSITHARYQYKPLFEKLK